MQNLNLTAYKKQRVLLSEADLLSQRLNKLYAQGAAFEQLQEISDRLDEITLAYNRLCEQLHSKCS